MITRSLLAAATISLAPLCTGCPGATAGTVISDIQAGVTDSSIALQAVAGIVDAYFVAHPNVALQVKIDNGITDASSALRILNTALSGATSMADGNVQTALTAFGEAWAQLMVLVSQIGVQAAPVGAKAGVVVGVTYVTPPRILGQLKAVKK